MEKRPKYSGGIETRTESDATNFELRRNYEASQKLKKLGTLIPVAGKKFYHGRAFEGEEFSVDPFFNNADNATGNRNINKGETVLHVAGHQTAREFAEARARRKGTMAEIAEMEISDQEASFFDCDQDEEDHNGRTEEARAAFAESFPEPVTGTVLSMEDYKSLDQNAFRELIQFAANTPILPEEDIPKFARILSISEDGARKLIGSINARSTVLRARDPHVRMSKHLLSMLDQKGDVAIWTTVADRDGKTKSIHCPINREFVHQWMRDNHIIGIKCSVNSATLGKPVFDAYEIFSLEDVKSKEQAEAARESRMRIFGGASLRVFGLLNGRESRRRAETPLTYLSMDRRGTPREFIDSAKQVGPKYQQLFEAGAGVKEGFTIEEHTETALRLFDASYKSNLPRSIYDFGRLCLLVHDIGKSVGRQNDQDQEGYNAMFSMDFLKDIKAPKELVDAVPLIITEGMEAAAGTILNKTPENQSKLWLTSHRIAKKLFGIDERSPDYQSCVKTVYHLCRTLAECDGAAYSTYAITTRTSSGVKHYNGNERHSRTFNSESNNPEYIRSKK